MSLENINLWFCKDLNEDIILITDIVNNGKKAYGKLYCPVCGSEVIPKAVSENCTTTPHFAHINKEKCSGESMIHFWFKHKFIEVGDTFSILKNDNITNYKCKSIDVEKIINTSVGLYIPDLTVITESGSEIYFEINYKNKKNIEDYIVMWNELKCIVIEVDVKKLIENSKIFSPLFYYNKTERKRRSKIEKAMDEMNERLSSNYYRDKRFFSGSDDENFKKLIESGYVIHDILKYKNNTKTIDDVSLLLNSLDEDTFDFIEDILDTLSCTDIMDEYFEREYQSRRDDFLSDADILENFTFNPYNSSIHIEANKEIQNILKSDYIDTIYYSLSRWIDLENSIYKYKERKLETLNQLIKMDCNLHELKVVSNIISNEIENFKYNKEYFNFEIKIKVNSDGSIENVVIKFGDKITEIYYDDINSFLKELNSEILSINNNVKSIDFDLNGLLSIVNNFYNINYKNSSFYVTTNYVSNGISVIKIFKNKKLVCNFYVNKIGLSSSIDKIKNNEFDEKFNLKVNPYVIFEKYIIKLMNK